MLSMPGWIKRGVIGALIVVVLFLMFSFSGSPASYAPERPHDLQTGVRADVAIDYGDGKITQYMNVLLVENETVFDLTRRLAEMNNLLLDFREYEGVGPFVVQIGEKISGDGVYWQYWINNEYATVGAGAYRVKPNDAVRWRFTGETP